MKEYYAVTLVNHLPNRTIISYTKNIFEGEIPAIEACQRFQEELKLMKISSSDMNYGVEPITEEDKKKVEAGEVVYL